MLNIDYEIMKQYLSLMQGEKSPEEKKDLIRKMREKMKHGSTARFG